MQAHPHADRCSLPPEKTEGVLGRDVEMSPYLYTSLKGHITQLYPFNFYFFSMYGCVPVLVCMYTHVYV